MTMKSEWRLATRARALAAGRLREVLGSLSKAAKSVSTKDFPDRTGLRLFPLNPHPIAVLG